MSAVERSPAPVKGTPLRWNAAVATIPSHPDRSEADRGTAGPFARQQSLAAAPAAPLGPQILAGLALVAASPLLLLTAAVIGVALGRPLLFRQERVGLEGRSVILQKFRTMTDARDADGHLLSDEERTTRLTRLVRRLRVDELTQLLAIVRGELAIVGPRPLLPHSIAAFGALGAGRCRVRPGLTGWAQVSGNTKLTDEEKLALDLWYVDRKSFFLDIRIILETLYVVIFGERRRPQRIANATRSLQHAYNFKQKTL